MDIEEYRREEYLQELADDRKHDYLDNGQCPDCKSFAIVEEEDGDGESVYTCEDCGKCFK